MIRQGKGAAKAPFSHLPFLGFIDLFQEYIINNQERIPAGNVNKTHQPLNFILQELHDKTDVGEKLIKPALNSPVVSSRQVTLSVLESWMNRSGQKIQEIAPSLSEYIQGLLPNEVREDIQQRME